MQYLHQGEYSDRCMTNERNMTQTLPEFEFLLMFVSCSEWVTALFDHCFGQLIDLEKKIKLKSDWKPICDFRWCNNQYLCLRKELKMLYFFHYYLSETRKMVTCILTTLCAWLQSSTLQYLPSNICMNISLLYLRSAIFVYFRVHTYVSDIRLVCFVSISCFGLSNSEHLSCGLR